MSPKHLAVSRKPRSAMTDDASLRLARPAARPRKRERTRARLIAATIEVLGAVGLEATTVLEITKAAHVSNGTFYLYFEDKSDAVNVAVVLVAREITRSIHRQEKSIANVAERAAFAIRRFFDVVLVDPSWVKAMLAVYVALPDLRRYVRVYMLRTLHEGLAQGAFSLKPSDTQIESLSAVLMTAVRMRIEGAPDPCVTAECVELILRMLGVGVPEARRLSGASVCAPSKG